MHKRYNEFINGPWSIFADDIPEKSHNYGPAINLFTGTYYLDDFFRDEQNITVYMYVWEDIRKRK